MAAQSSSKQATPYSLLALTAKLPLQSAFFAADSNANGHAQALQVLTQCGDLAKACSRIRRRRQHSFNRDTSLYRGD